jgi:hypothetical protein
VSRLHEPAKEHGEESREAHQHLPCQLCLLQEAKNTSRRYVPNVLSTSHPLQNFVLSLSW